MTNQLIPVSGGAFFMEEVNVAKACKTNDISAIRCLGKGHLPLSFSSSTYLITTSWNRCNNEVTTSLFTKPISVTGVARVVDPWADRLGVCMKRLGLPLGPRKEN